MGDDSPSSSPQKQKNDHAAKRMEEMLANMDSVSRRLHQNRKRGKKFLQRGMEILQRSQGIANFMRFDDAASFFYKSFISFKICSQWMSAGESVEKCAEMHMKSGMALEATSLYIEAAEVYAKVNITESMRATRLAVDICVNIGRFDIAGRLERSIAEWEFSSKHWEDAANSFKKAANYLSGDMSQDQCDWCMERCAECYVELNELELASETYQLVAKGCLQSNLRRLTSIKKLYMSVVCLIGIPQDVLTDADGKIKYGKIRDVIYSYDDLDFMWATSDEVMFLENIIDARLTFNQHMFADHLYFWDNVRVLHVIDLRMFKVMSHEIDVELARLEEIRIKQELEREKERMMKEKLKEKKKLMEDLGIKGKPQLSEDDMEAIEEGANKIMHIDEGVESSGLAEEESVDVDVANIDKEIEHLTDNNTLETDDFVEDEENGLEAVRARNKARADKRDNMKNRPERRKREKK